MRKNKRVNEIFYINRNDKLALCWVAKSTHKANDYGGYDLRKPHDIVWYFRYVVLDGFSLPSYRAFKTKTEALAYQTRFLDRRNNIDLTKEILGGSNMSTGYTTRCPKCGHKVSAMYGHQVFYNCPKCGHDWVEYD